ncbi:epidermal growth factor receptor-like [Babylonia areolata]|uniref:epidermal growth factor receptor-like n=1 Tax=Babylonia areolata TaxID=304850 RepID=UPI003FD532DB
MEPSVRPPSFSVAGRLVVVVVVGAVVLCVLPCPTIGDPVPVLGEEKVCHVNSALTSYGNSTVHERRLRLRYQDCTHIVGDLIIAFLDDPNISYDLSFLSKVRYVSGFVAIIANSFPAEVALPSLQVIRGNQTFNGGKQVRGVPEVSLLVSINDHQQISMPNLKEVSSGNVLIDLENCPHLCYLATIDWRQIVREGSAHVTNNNALCPSCSNVCEWPGRGRHCWGPTDDLCQHQKQECPSSCEHGLCTSRPPVSCCSPDCAMGCHGPSPSQCTACRDYRLEDGSCSSHCPMFPPHVLNGQNCTAMVPRLGAMD